MFKEAKTPGNNAGNRSASLPFNVKLAAKIRFAPQHNLLARKKESEQMTFYILRKKSFSRPDTAVFYHVISGK